MFYWKYLDIRVDKYLVTGMLFLTGLSCDRPMWHVLPTQVSLPTAALMGVMITESSEITAGSKVEIFDHWHLHMDLDEWGPPDLYSNLLSIKNSLIPIHIMQDIFFPGLALH